MSITLPTHHTRRLAALLGLAGMLALILAFVGPAGSPVFAQPGTLTGVLHIRWGDPPPGVNAPIPPRYFLADDQGQESELELGAAAASAAGGPLTLNRKRVVVTPVPGPRLASGRIAVQSIQPAPSGTGAPTTSSAAAATSGAVRWVTILCRFADATGVTPQPASYFTNLMGSTAPGLDHYWRQTSYQTINLTGSTVVGWYNLPQPRATYVTSTGLDFTRAATDCTAAADAAVYFPNFAGINLMFNQDLDCCAWGGATTLSRDGQQRTYSTTWIPPWGYQHQSVLGHEMGHGLGLPHSSGPYTQTYDSQWDVMSGGGRCTPRDATYGCLGVHTISFHKDLLGWIPAARKYSASGSKTVTLERLAEPGSSGYLMAQIAVDGSSTRFYTVEARRFAGYDTGIPAEGLVIHLVDRARGDRLAQVVDVDGNGNPNDAGAIWMPGETFEDRANGITVRVDGATANGWRVTITAPVTYPDGILVQEQSTDPVYLVRDNRFYWVSSDAELGNWTGAITKIPDGTVIGRSSMSGGICGAVVRERSYPEVYYLRYGVKYWIPDPTVLQGYGGWGAVKVVPNGALTFLTPAGRAPTTPPACSGITSPSTPARYADGTLIPERKLVREQSSAPVYVVLGGTLHWVATQADVSYWGGWGSVTVVPDGTLSSPQRETQSTIRGNVCGILVRERPHAEVYYLRYGMKYWIPSHELVEVYGGWNAVKVVPDEALVFLSYAGQAPATPPSCESSGG
jgi:hypothetical protein